MVLLDKSGHIVSGGPISANGNRYLSAPSTLVSALGAPAVLSKPTTPGGTTRCGVLHGGARYYLYCSAPVVHTTGAGPDAGTLVAMESLDRAGAATIGRRAGISLRVASGSSPAPPMPQRSPAPARAP